MFYTLTLWILLFSVVTNTDTAKQVPLLDLKQYKYEGQSEVVSLAQNQRVILSFNASISNTIEIISNRNSQCQLHPIVPKSKTIKEVKIDMSADSVIFCMLALINKSLLFVLDQSNNLHGYSLDNKNLLSPVLNKTKIFQANINYARMVATEDQSIIYILTSAGYYYFQTSTLGTYIKKLDVYVPISVSNAIFYKKTLYVAQASQGLQTYTIQENTNFLIEGWSDTTFYCNDIALQKGKNIFFGLDKNIGVRIYNISGPSKLDEITIINTQNITKQNLQIEVQKNTILIFFKTNDRKIIAELDFRLEKNSYTLIRYFKFQTESEIHQIHLNNENLIIIGDTFLSIYLVKIHPRLIKKGQNQVVGSKLKTVILINLPFYIGITDTSIVYQEISMKRQRSVQCTLVSASSEPTKFIYRANQTVCQSGKDRQYNQYCAYIKQYNIKKMDIVVKAETVEIVWMLMMIFLFIMITGMIIIGILRNRNKKILQKMQREFQEKRKTIVPPNSNRQGQ